MPKLRLTAYLAAYFFFAPVAMAANLYVDNTLIYSGTAVSGGTTTTIVMNAAFNAAFSPSLTTNDSRIRYMGLFVTGGTGASQNHHKISAYDATTFTITFATALSGSSDATTAFDITTGCDSNTGASATVGATNVGPTLTVTTAYEAASANDTVWVKASGAVYTEREKSNASNQYMYLWRNVSGITIQGYSATTNDLNTSPSTTYTTSADGTVFTVTGGTAKTTAGKTWADNTSASAPVWKPQDTILNASFYLDGAATLTIRNMNLQSAGTRIFAVNNPAAAANITIDQCTFGDGSVNSQYGLSDLQNTNTHTLNITKCKFHTRGSNVILRSGTEVNITDSEFVLNPNATTVANIEITMKGSAPTVAYDSTNDVWYASDQIRRIKVDSCKLSATAEQASCPGIYCYDTDGSSSVGASWTEHFQITRNSISVTSSSPILLVTMASVEIGSNECYTNSASGGGTLINLAPDASPTAGPGSSLRKLIRRSTCQAGSGSGTVIIDASASASNNVYRYRSISVYKADGTALQHRPISGYTGASKTVAYAVDGSNATMSPTPASGDLYEIWEQRPQTILIHDNFCKHNQDVSGNTHGMLIGQGWDAARVWSNTIINSDNGIVAKGEYPVIWGNRVYAGRGTMLPKGGGMGTCINNTFVCARSQGGGGCLDLQDKSTVAVSASTTALFRGEWGKCSGWVFLNNIFAVKGQSTFCVNDNQADVGTWQGWASLDPGAQRNYFDWNLYAMDADNDGVYDGGSSNPISYIDGANVNTLAAQQTKWTDTTYQKSFYYNDAHSYSRWVPMVDPANGNFTPQIRLTGNDGQMIGAPIPMTRASRIPVVGAGS